MPLFFLLAGFTIKSIQLNSFSKLIKKDFIRLIIPVFIMRGVNLAVSTFIKKAPFIDSLWDNIRRILWGNGNNYGPLPFPIPLQMYGVGVLWFLIAIFWARCFYRLFDYKIKEYRFIILLIFAFLGMWVGSILRLPHCVDMMPLILLFMESGNYIKNKVDIKSVRWRELGIVSFFVWIYLVCDRGIYIEMATRKYPYSMLCVLIAILGCIVVIQFSQGLQQFRCSKGIIFLGRNSLDLLCIHHIDSYFSFVWKINLFSEGSKLFFANEVITSLVRVLLDIILLLIWVGIKTFLKRKRKRNYNLAC